MAPWELAKNDSSKKQLEAVIYNLLEGLRVLSGLVYPFMPETAETMQKHLGLKADEDFFTFNMLKAWNFIKPGSKILKSTTLFPRIKPEDIDPERLKKIEGAKEKKMRFLPEISIDLLSQVDLRVGTVLHAEKIAKAKKLLKLEVDIGEKRTIVAGIAESYSTQDLIGKQVIIVANLKPAKLMGILSNGMLLAAVDEDKTAVATLDKPFKSGAKLR
jgi:methionyl-tRNA synthetase